MSHSIVLRCDCGNALGTFEVAAGTLALRHARDARERADRLAIEHYKRAYSPALAEAVINRGTERTLSLIHI